MLAAAGIPTLTHGGDRMPTKYGIPLRKSLAALGFTAGPAEPGRGTTLASARKLRVCLLAPPLPHRPGSGAISG